MGKKSKKNKASRQTPPAKPAGVTNTRFQGSAFVIRINFGLGYFWQKRPTKFNQITWILIPGHAVGSLA